MSRSTLRLDIMIALVAVALVAVFAIAVVRRNRPIPGRARVRRPKRCRARRAPTFPTSSVSAAMAVATKRLPSALLTWVIGTA
ncbi:MAG: hypothetical protein ACLT98_05020 [Eggerthellaceae bacterium]